MPNSLSFKPTPLSRASLNILPTTCYYSLNALLSIISTVTVSQVLVDSGVQYGLPGGLDGRDGALPVGVPSLGASPVPVTAVLPFIPLTAFLLPVSRPPGR